MFRKILLLTLVLILSVSFAYGAKLYCGIKNPSGTPIKSYNVTLKYDGSESECIVTLSTCSVVGTYTGYSYSDDEVNWVYKFNTNNPYHVSSSTNHAKDNNDETTIVGYGIAKTGGTDRPSTFATDSNTIKCCDTNTDCVTATFDCTSAGDTLGDIPDRAWCSNSIWYGGDHSTTACNEIVETGRWDLGGDTTTGDCCGDDSGENVITEANMDDAPSGYNDGTTACCDNSLDCNYNDDCYATHQTSTQDIPYKAYCFENYWYGGDHNLDVCNAIVETGRWDLGGDTTTGDCCGDDNFEYKITEASSTDAPSGYNTNTVTTCCDTNSDCTNDDTCYATGTASNLARPDKAACSNKIWYGGDVNSGNCTVVMGAAGFWNLGGEVNATVCCGDDNDQFRITEAGLTDAPADYKNGITTCCDTATDCTYDDTCYDTASTSSQTIPNKAYCDGSNLWHGGDDSLAACNAIAGIGKWNADGWQGESTTKCCGDDLNEYNVSSDGRAACCNNPTDWVDDTYNCRGDLEQASWFYGRVINATSGDGIGGATVTALGGDRDDGCGGDPGVYFSNRTNSDGYYTLFVMVDRTYDLMASAIRFAPNTTSNVYIGYEKPKSVNFSLYAAESSCEADCTFSNDETCHAECEGYNGCYFYNTDTKADCNNMQKGWVVGYSGLATGEMNVVCCTGAPTPRLSAVLISSDVSSANKVQQRRLLIYQGRPVWMVVDVFI